MLALILTGAFAVAQRAGEDLGEIRVGVPDTVRRVQVVSPDPALQRLVQRAFAVHGAYEVRSSGSVHFVFTFRPIDERTVELTITSGDQELFRQRQTGRDVNSAALAAADLAVTRTVGLPGFFSGSIATIGKRDGQTSVYLSDFFYQRMRQLTRDRALCMLPNLSPDGRTLIYTSYHRSGFPELFKIDLTTNRRDLFMGYRGLNTGATYSPDGRSIAMILSGDGNSEVYVSDADGGNIRRLTRTQGLESDPSWSPDGQRLVFQSDDLGRPQIFTMRADGSDRRRVPTNISGNCSEPRWNPRDPNLIVFTAAMGREFELCIYDFTKRESRVISRGAGDAIEPAWLPDGRHLLYTERTRQTSRIAILDTVTGKKSYLTTAEMGHFSMAAYTRASVL